ncbi:MAG: quinolinate synthase NadA [Bacteroidales bacterium]
MIKDVNNRVLLDGIEKLRREKNAVILAHYYQNPEIQDIADFVGDSLALSQQAAQTKADLILFAGVHFMAETAKILSPAKKVLLPDLTAGCSLADSCPADQFALFKKAYPEHTVVSYVNTTAAIKTMTDIVCTSTNALAIINALPPDEKIIFAPDKNLGDYIKRKTGRENMVIWDGACHVHEKFSLEKMLQLKQSFPDSQILAHPECKKPILMVSDFIGSTSALLSYSSKSACTTFIVATESGILHQMQKASPEKQFIPAPPDDASCACNDCQFMKTITLQKMYDSLLYDQFEITIPEEIRILAEKPILRMLTMSKQLNLI